MGDTAGMTAAQATDMQAASMGASAITSIAGGFENAAAMKAQGNYASSIATTNASMARLKASQTLEAGDVAASRKDLETRGAVGTARAIAGGSGVDVNKGSPAMVQAGIETAGGVDVATIKNNAARAAWGYQTQAIQDTYTAQFETLTAKQKAIQSITTGGLSAISQPLSMYSQRALWDFRYGGRGAQGPKGQPFPDTSSSSDDFWGAN
jgi:hypothetical protein